MPTSQIALPGRVLLVEDSSADAALTEHAFAKAAPSVQLDHVTDGIACLQYLRREAPYAAANAPDLILLDLNMPRMDGRSVMSEIAADDALRNIPVVVLTTSSNPSDVEKMYALRCSGYVVKPSDYSVFERFVSNISHYWFETMITPDRA